MGVFPSMKLSTEEKKVEMEVLAYRVWADFDFVCPPLLVSAEKIIR